MMKAVCFSYALALNLKWCSVLYEHVTSDLMWCHWTFRPFDLLFFSCRCWYYLSFSLMSAHPLCSCCHSSPVVRQFVLLSKALDRWAGVHNPRWVFCGYLYQHRTLFIHLCFHASSLHYRSLVLDWRTLLHGCWRFEQCKRFELV